MAPSLPVIEEDADCLNKSKKYCVRPFIRFTSILPSQITHAGSFNLTDLHEMNAQDVKFHHLVLERDFENAFVNLWQSFASTLLVYSGLDSSALNGWKSH